MFLSDPEFLNGPTWLGKREDILMRWIDSFQGKAGLQIKLHLISRGDLGSNFLVKHDRIQFNQ